MEGLFGEKMRKTPVEAGEGKFLGARVSTAGKGDGGLQAQGVLELAVINH